MIQQMVGWEVAVKTCIRPRIPFRMQNGIASKSRNVNGVPTSLAQLGYTDVGLDDFWQECGRCVFSRVCIKFRRDSLAVPCVSYGPDKYTYHNAEGTPVINFGKFPDMLK